MCSEIAGETQHAFDELLALVERARAMASDRIRRAASDGKLDREAYVRFLTNQYHLTRGVQKHLLRVVASERLARLRSLREFLFRFAIEEEPHYLLALRDLEALGEPLRPTPLETAMWWAYFDAVIDREPFQRLGGTCVLENIGVGLGSVVKEMFNKVPFLTPKTTRFLMLHLHEQIPHGEQILTALKDSKLALADLNEVITGTRVAAITYLRMIDWYFRSNEVVASFEPR